MFDISKTSILIFILIVIVILLSIPTIFKWFGDNWKNVLTNMWNAYKAYATNLFTNFKNLFTSIWSWIKGNGFDFTFTPLLEGFESTLAELPKIAKRSITPLS